MSGSWARFPEVVTRGAQDHRTGPWLKPSLEKPAEAGSENAQMSRQNDCCELDHSRKKLFGLNRDLAVVQLSPRNLASCC